MKRVLLIFTSFLPFGLIAADLVEGIPSRLYSAGKVTLAPKIDGKLDDPCWNQLPIMDQFIRVITRRGSPQARTVAQAGYDEKNLYIAVHCAEPSMTDAKRVIGVGEQAFGESVEIFLDPRGKDPFYQQYRVGLGGQTERRIGTALAEDQKSWSAMVQCERDGWTAEIAIPWRLIGGGSQPPFRMGFNISRCRGSVSPVEFTSWSEVRTSFHETAYFGDLVFTDYRAWLCKYTSDGFGEIQKRVRSLVKQHPVSTLGMREEVTRLESIARAAQEHCKDVRNEDEALKTLAVVSKEIRQAEEIYGTVRLAVIKGEFQ